MTDGTIQLLKRGLFSTSLFTVTPCSRQVLLSFTLFFPEHSRVIAAIPHIVRGVSDVYFTPFPDFVQLRYQAGYRAVLKIPHDPR